MFETRSHAFKLAKNSFYRQVNSLDREVITGYLGEPCAHYAWPTCATVFDAYGGEEGGEKILMPGINALNIPLIVISHTPVE